MVQSLLIGLGAGAASALLFASVANGSLISVLLFYLAPLPIMIAALGWSHWSGLIAAFAAAAGLALAIGGYFFLPFILGVGLPAWWLGYLTLLARPAAGGNGAAALDWYPTGRLVLWSAVLGTLIVVAAIPTFGLDYASFRSSLRHGFEQVLRTQGDVPSSGAEANNLDRLLDVLVVVIPPAAAVLSTTINLTDLWLAARVVRLSGRLRRPWPDLTALRLPRLALPLTAAGLLACLSPGLAGTIAGIFVATMLIAYAASGLAALHYITRGKAGRSVVLGGTYALLVLFGWPVVVLALLGLVDGALDLRARMAKPPPSSSTT